MNLFSFRKPLFIWTACTLLFFSFVFWRGIYVTQEDRKSYENQAQAQLKKHIARKKGVKKELSKQTRWDVTKRIWLSDKLPRQEIEIHGSRSEVDVFMHKSEARLVETIYDVQG